VTEGRYADAFTHHHSGTKNWVRNRREVEVPENAYYVEIGLINQMTGHLYFDDVKLILNYPHPWEKKETKYITFYYLDGYPYPEGAIEKETQIVKGFVKKLGIKIKGGIKYYYYPSEEKFKDITGRTRYRQLPLWKKRELHTMAPIEDHAIAHMLLSDFGYPPAGLAKGIVFNLRGSLEGKDIHTVAKEFLVQKQIPSLHKLLKVDDFNNLGTTIAVPAWTSFCKYLIDRYGMKKLMKLYAETDGVDDYYSFNKAFMDVYGEVFLEVDQAWRLWLVFYENEQEGSTL
jgi:hypothetical protein